MDSNKLFTHERLTKFVNDYKDYIQEKKTEQGENSNGNFEYYHFDYNPNGIITSLIGRYSHEILSEASSWSPMTFKNGIDGWKITLARGLTNYKKREQEKFRENSLSGLNFIINYDELPTGIYYGQVNIDIDQDHYALKVATEYNDRGTDNSVLGVSYDLTNLNNGTNDKLYNKKENMNYKLVTVNWYGLFYGEIGSYKIKCEGENCTFYLWFGDEAICEYTHYTCIINNNKTESDDLFFSYDKYVPIRIQCYYYGNVQNTVDFKVSVQKLITNQERRVYKDIDLNKVFFHSPTPPLVLYHAYVSLNEQDFINDEFLCVSLVDIKDDELYVKDYSNLLIFYSRFRQFLSNSYNNEYDYNEDNRLSYGVIPNINIQYTIQGMEGHPFAYSIYKINSDPRMGKTYQINTKIDDNISYPMKEMKITDNNSLLSYSDVYTTYSGFYPNRDSLDVRFYNESIDADPLQCKEQCNKNPNCGYYFTFKSLGNDKCVINSDNKEPSFNRIAPKQTHRPIDENTSSLYMRNYKLNISPEKRECIKIGSTSSDTIDVKNSSNYSNTFEYSFYNMDKTPIQSVDEMGICGDEEYIQFKNDSADLLFKDTTYYNDGTWIENFESKEPVSKYTDVMEDTKDAIRTNLSNEQIYKEKSKNIDKKLKKLRNDIPNYHRMKDVLKSKEHYDYDGDELYFRKKRHHHLLEKKIMDHNQLYLNTKLLYTLGTVTCATLIILAILIARD